MTIKLRSPAQDLSIICYQATLEVSETIRGNCNFVIVRTEWKASQSNAGENAKSDYLWSHLFPKNKAAHRKQLYNTELKT